MIACLASCSPESEIQELSDVYISFQTAVQKSAVIQTRTIIEGDQLPEDLSIGVYAKPVENESWSSPSLSNMKFLSDGAGGFTEGISVKLLEGSNFDFYAYSPHSGSIVYRDGVPCLPITIASNINSQDDILYASKRTSLTGKFSTVDLEFRHVLSRLKFCVETPKETFDHDYGPVFRKIVIQTEDTQTGCVLNLATGEIQSGNEQNKVVEHAFSSTHLYKEISPLLLTEFALIPTRITSITIYWDNEDQRERVTPFLENALEDKGGLTLQAGCYKTVVFTYDNHNLTLRKPIISGGTNEVDGWQKDGDYTIEIQ